MPRFVLLRHECPPDYRDGPHWDLMLERTSTGDEHRLATWSLLTLPAAWGTMLGREVRDATETVEATRLVDHRAVYLDREGPIGGGRGVVERWARGGLEWLSEEATRCETATQEGAPVEARLRFEGVDRSGPEQLGADRSGVLRLEAVEGDRWRLFWAGDPA